MTIENLLKTRSEETRTAREVLAHRDAAVALLAAGVQAHGATVAAPQVVVNLDALLRAREELNKLVYAARKITPVQLGGWKKEAA